MGMKRFYVILTIAAALLVAAAAPSFSQAVDSPAARETGLLVVRVLPDTPAAKAGIIRGDIITALDGNAVATVAGVNKLLADRKAGQTVTLTVFRGESEKTVPVVLEDRLYRPILGLNLAAAVTEPDKNIGQAEDDPGDGMGRILPIQPIQPGLWLEAKIQEVVKGSPADKAGLNPGERIVAVDEVLFNDTADLAEIIGKHKSGDKLNLSVLDVVGMPRRATVVLDEVDGKPRLGVSYRMMATQLEYGRQDRQLQKRFPQLLDKLPDFLEKLQDKALPKVERSVL